jgi:hypothetical protein
VIFKPTENKQDDDCATRRRTRARRSGSTVKSCGSSIVLGSAASKAWLRLWQRCFRPATLALSHRASAQETLRAQCFSLTARKPAAPQWERSRLGRSKSWKTISRALASICSTTLRVPQDGYGPPYQRDYGPRYQRDYGPPVERGPQLRLDPGGRRDEGRYSPPNPASRHLTIVRRIIRFRMACVSRIVGARLGGRLKCSTGDAGDLSKSGLSLAPGSFHPDSVPQVLSLSSAHSSHLRQLASGTGRSSLLLVQAEQLHRLGFGLPLRPAPQWDDAFQTFR